MGKYNCDVCGTAYPDSATQCPICGCVRSTDTIDSQKGNGTYTYVKGGRFSKSNLRKRNHGMPQYLENTPDDQGFEEVTSDRGLAITVCVLLLAIVAVVIYIITKFFSVDLPGTQNGGMQESLPSAESTVSTIQEEMEATFLDETVETTEATEEATEPETVYEDPYVDYVRPFKLNKSDVTLHVSIKESFELFLKDANGNVVDVDWIFTKPDICVLEGNEITCTKIGTVRAEATIDGITYSCVIRVVE